MPQLPSKDRLEYWKLLAETLLAVLLLPVVIYAIFRDPHHAADKALGKGL